MLIAASSSSDRRRPGRPAVGRWTRRFDPLLLVVCLAALTGCHREPVALSFADYLEHQRDQVTTGLISLPGGINRHLLDFGWQHQEGDPGHASLVQSQGHVRFFAARGEIRQLAVRAASVGALAPRRYRVLLNGKAVGVLGFDHEWRSERLDLPPKGVRHGVNLLTIRCLECPAGWRHQETGLRLQQLRFLPATAHRQTMRRSDTDRRRFLMPAPAYLDLVARLPLAASFRGEVALTRQSGDPVTVRLSVLSAAGEEQLGEWRLDDHRKVHSLRADLGSWDGRMVRLRLAADADGEAELDWRSALIRGTSTDEDGRLPVIAAATPPRSGRLGRPDVFVVLLDAARADAFSPFGGSRPTPVMELLASEGTRFLEALSPSSWTRPSVAALLTGFYPDALGAEAWGAAPPIGTPTLAELLSAAGYRTLLWHQHPFYRGQADMQRGFEEVHWARSQLVDPVPPAELLTVTDRPTFALIHLLPPHAPYAAPAPYGGAYSSWYRGELAVTARWLNEFHHRRDPSRLSDEDRRYIRDLYQENVAYADSLVGRIRDLLVAAGRYQNSLFVVLSDHGEAFLEHGRFLHTQQLYDESIRVPLIVKWPTSTTGYRAVVEQPVSLVDLMPTLVDGLGLPAEHRFQGRSLLPPALDGRRFQRSLYATTRGASESWRPPSPRAALRFDRWKAVYEPHEDRIELYDTVDDPRETRDLADRQSLVALQARQALLEQMALHAGLLRPDAAVTAAPLDPEVERQLRGLGYLGQE